MLTVEQIREKALSLGATVFGVGGLELFEGENFISHTNSEIFIGNSHSSKNIYKKE